MFVGKPGTSLADKIRQRTLAEQCLQAQIVLLLGWLVCLVGWLVGWLLTINVSTFPSFQKSSLYA
jgi:hypothetical protein